MKKLISGMFKSISQTKKRSRTKMKTKQKNAQRNNI